MTRRLILTLSLGAVFASQAWAIEPSSSFHVYWDVSHGVVDNYRPTGRYSVLVDHLVPLGFQFTEGNVPLDAADLNSFDVLVLANGSFASAFPSSEELLAVQSFLQNGGGLLVLSDISGSSGTQKIQQIANLFDAEVGLAKFPPDDVFSTSVISHPSVAGVNQMYIRFSSTIEPGDLTTYALYNSMPMLAAGEFGGGRIVLIADGDLFTYPPSGPHYFDQADNRRLAASVFQYLAVPEPGTFVLSLISAAVLFSSRRMCASSSCARN